MKKGYLCGHEGDTIILDNNILSITAYFEWVETNGWQGNNTKCWGCWTEEVLRGEKNG